MSNNRFEYRNQFNTDNAFESVKFGYDSPVLEVELNELQEIQNHNRKSFINKVCKSGIIESVDKDFKGEKIIYNPNNENNCIAIAPMRVNIAGYEVHICGDYKVEEIKNYLKIDLGEAPSGMDSDSTYRNDLVYLQIWIDDISSDDIMKRYGHSEGISISNTIIDKRVGEETSRRTGLKWKIRIAENVDFDRWEYGFGFDNSGAEGYSNITTDINLLDSVGKPIDNINRVYANACYNKFIGCTFYGDNNLWVAGKPDAKDPSNTNPSQFSFAIPFFRVDRRNKKMYSIGNPNGSSDFKNRDINLRPDGKCYDKIYDSDILDIRKQVIINNTEYDFYLDDTIEKVFTGKLTTKSKEKMKRIQFGVRPLEKTTNNLIFLDSFNTNLIPDVGNRPTINKRTPQTVLDYSPSVTEWGLNFNGDVELVYSISNVDVDQGTIEFFIIPSWNGFDSINQPMFKLLYNTGDPFITMEKEGNTFLVKRYQTTDNTVKPAEMKVGINRMAKNKVYHVRIVWTTKEEQNIKGRFECYINGKLWGNSLNDITRGSVVGVTRLSMGNNFTIPKNEKLGFIMDEFSIYKTYTSNMDWRLPMDVVKGDAMILPSFNHVFRNYRDNDYEQKDTVTYKTTTTNTTEFTITSPRDTLFGSEVPNVYIIQKTSSTSASVAEGTKLTGTWTGLNTGTLKFTLNTSSVPGFNKFTGEKLAIDHSLLLEGGNQIDDIPNELLRAEVEGLIEPPNTTKRVIREASFNVENNTGTVKPPREVNSLITAIKQPDGSTIYKGRRYIYDVMDRAYDTSTFRNASNKDFAFGRMIEYHEEGNGTNLYNIPLEVYGCELLYVRRAFTIRNNPSGPPTVTPINITKMEIVSSTTNPSMKYLAVSLRKNIYHGDIIRFELATGGFSFDYNANSKTFVGNMCLAEFLEFKTTGDRYEYLIPFAGFNSNEMVNRGVLYSLGTNYVYPEDSSGNTSDTIPDSYKGEYICYRGKDVYKYTYIDGIGKPYLKLRISQFNANNVEEKIPEGETIKIPVFVSYQPSSEDILSVWYNYIPYQGVLEGSIKKIRRLSEWKTFVTTLSSGNSVDKYNLKNSYNNLINRLPGGSRSSMYITGQDIDFKGYEFSSYPQNNGFNLDRRLIFTKDIYVGSKDKDIDSSVFELDTLYTTYKPHGNIQDGALRINKNFKIFLPISEKPINSYCGMCSIVSDENGDVYLFVIGDTNNDTPSISNGIYPTYGDLYIVPYRPSLINRN